MKLRPIIQLFAIAVLAICLCSCGKSGSDQAGDTKSAAEGASAKPIEIITKSGIEMVYLPGGEFTMGSKQGHPDEAPPHRVGISAFLMDKFEVTHEMFTKVQLPNPSRWQDNPKKPVERVRWRDAKQYCNERSLLEGLKPCYNEKTADWNCDYAANGYRLPTEAEWEYACRAGTEGAYDFGAPDKLRQYAWFGENSDQKTHPIGQKKPNRWGLYDLYGNVSEWCEDVYSPAYYQASLRNDPQGPASPGKDPQGPASPGKDVKRVIRGGSWKAGGESCRASFRQSERTGDTDACFFTDYCGFRCVRRAIAEELKELKAQKK